MRSIFFAAYILCLFSVGEVFGQEQAEAEVAGWLTDTLSGARGATPKNIASAKRNVASGRAKYAVYDEATKKLYILEPQATAEAYLGQRVVVKGTLASSRLTSAGQALDPGTQEVKSVAPPERTAAMAIDTSTPIAGVLTITSISPAPDPQQARAAAAVKKE